MWVIRRVASKQLASISSVMSSDNFGGTSVRSLERHQKWQAALVLHRLVSIRQMVRPLCDGPVAMATDGNATLRNPFLRREIVQIIGFLSWNFL